MKVLASSPAGEVLVHLGSSNYLDRYKIYVAHVQEWRQQFNKLESVDLRYERQIVVNPDLQGAPRQAPISVSAAKVAMAAGVKPAALISRSLTLPKPRPAAPEIMQAKVTMNTPAKEPVKPSAKPAANSELQNEDIARPSQKRPSKKDRSRKDGPEKGRPEAGQAQRRIYDADCAEFNPVSTTSTSNENKPSRASETSEQRGETRKETEPGDCQGTGSSISMANQYEHILTAIDVGSAKTCALVAEITETGLRYRGHGVAESRGSRKGVIVELDKAVGSIQKAVEEAEDVAGAPIEHALLGVAGAHVRGVNSHGGISFGTRSARDLRVTKFEQAVEKARAIPLPADREILHLLPQEFILDDQTGVHDPLGMMATRLEVRVHMVTAAASATQNVVTAVNRAGVHVDDTVFEPLAARNRCCAPMNVNWASAWPTSARAPPT